MLFIDKAWPTKLLEKSMNLFKKPPRLVLIMVVTQLVVLVLSLATTNNALAVDQKKSPHEIAEDKCYADRNDCAWVKCQKFKGEYTIEKCIESCEITFRKCMKKAQEAVRTNSSKGNDKGGGAVLAPKSRF
jgi:hypothetical protein